MTEPTMNQYAPPRAHVADAAPTAEVAEMKLFSAKGRIGRLRYLAYGTGASWLYYIVLMALPIGMAGTAALNIFLFASAVALMWFNIVTGIKRCHDLNISGWWSLTLVVPVIVLVWMFVPGSKGENDFGPPPPANTWGIRLLGLLLPVIFLIGILAAIAIPQYKHYTDRARAAQAAGPR